MKKLKIPIPKKNEQYKFVKEWYSPNGSLFDKDMIVKVIGHKSLNVYQKTNYDQFDFDDIYLALKVMGRKAIKPRMMPKLEYSEKTTFWKSAVCEKHFVKVSKK